MKIITVIDQIEKKIQIIVKKLISKLVMTVIRVHQHKEKKIRLACIDTFELRGAKANPVQAKEARHYLDSLVTGKDVDIRIITKDKYGRTVAELSINGINVQQIMVTKGYAKIYSNYAYQ